MSPVTGTDKPRAAVMPRFRWVLGVVVLGLAGALVGVVPDGVSAVTARKECRATAFVANAVSGSVSTIDVKTGTKNPTDIAVGTTPQGASGSSPRSPDVDRGRGPARPPRMSHDRAVRRTLAVFAAGLALAFAAQPASAKDDPKRTMTEIGAALEAHGISPCDTPDWTKKSYGKADEPTTKGESVLRTRVVVGPGRFCPDRAAYASETDWEDATDGYLIYGVYKSKSSKAYKKQTRSDGPFAIYAYKRALILEPLGDVLQEPFTAAMADLGARRT